MMPNLTNAIYPCFSCPAEFHSYEACQDHIDRAHSDEVQAAADQVWNSIYAKRANVGKRIFCGYEEGYYFIRCEPDVQIAILQSVPKSSKYRLIIDRQNRHWIFVKQRCN